MPGPLEAADKHIFTRRVAFKGGPYVAALTAALVLDATYPNFLSLDPNGADRTVTLPAEATSSGDWFIVGNTGSQGEELTINDDGGSAVVVLGAGEVAHVVCNGTAWTVLWTDGGTTSGADRNGVQFQTLTGALTLTIFDQATQILDPGGASRVVTLPAEADSTGKRFRIRNAADGEEKLTINNDAAGLIGVVQRGDFAEFVCDGTTWTVVQYQQSVNTLFCNEETLAGTKTLTSIDPRYQVLDPDGSDRDVVLPAEEVVIARDFVIRHGGGANNLVVKNDAGSTLVTLAAGDTAIVAFDGASAWVLVHHLDIA